MLEKSGFEKSWCFIRVWYYIYEYPLLLYTVLKTEECHLWDYSQIWTCFNGSLLSVDIVYLGLSKESLRFRAYCFRNEAIGRWQTFLRRYYLYILPNQYCEGPIYLLDAFKFDFCIKASAIFKSKSSKCAKESDNLSMRCSIVKHA